MAWSRSNAIRSRRARHACRPSRGCRSSSISTAARGRRRRWSAGGVESGAPVGGRRRCGSLRGARVRGAARARGATSARGGHAAGSDVADRGLPGAAVAVGGFEETTNAQRFAARARRRRCGECDRPARALRLRFGAIVNRSPLVIGISTDGAAPVFGQAIRAKLEAVIPRGFARWADAARRWRKSVQSVRPFAGRSAAVLAVVCGLRAPPSGARAGTKRFRRTFRQDQRPRHRHAGRRGSWRSGTAYAARSTCAASGGHHSHRRPGLAGHRRFRSA